MPPIPEKMKAVLLTGYGGFDKLEYRDDVPVPQPGSLRPLLQYGELLPEDEVFGGQLDLVAKKRSKKNADHL